MADFFKSALGGIIGSGGQSQGNDFVGQTVELGNQKLRIKRLIAEGGYAFVFVAQDLSSGKEYALKRLLANDKEKNKLVLEEIQYLKRLSGHCHIIEFIAAASISKEQTDHGQSEYLILTEFCPGGQLVDELNRLGKPPTFDQVLLILHQTCLAVRHMHQQKPAIIHRDLKAENLLISSQGSIKLCDFGSATTQTHYPDTSWSAIQRSVVEDEITRNTTPMYRAPEMLDLYQNFAINEACDIWALGCLLFKLCFVEHPFEDSAKLRIINANYVIPDTDTQFELFHDLIRGMLTINPENRPTIDDVLERIQEIAQARNINLREVQIFSKMAYSSSSYSTPDTEERRQSPYQPGPQASQSDGVVGGFASAGSLFNSLKGGAGSVFKNIKDASNKVMETVSSTINKSDLDISIITSRMLVMSYPAEGMESAIKNHIDDVRSYLESKHRGSYAVYNLSQRSYRTAKFEDRVSECGWVAKKAPPLNTLFAICKNMHLWLRQKPKNICVIHCLDGKANSACIVGSFLMFCRMFENSSAALHLFTARRSPSGVSASQKRYIGYIGQMVADSPTLPHTKPVLLKAITLNPVPLFNKMKNGCTPFVEVYVGEERVLSTSQEYERMRQHTLEDGAVNLPINTSVSGDITIIVFHARSTFGGKIQGKITSMKICQLQFHTGFINEDTTQLPFTQYDLDQLDTADKYPEMFHVTLDLLVSPKEKSQGDRKFPWENVAFDKLNPRILFSSKDEMHQTFSDFAVSDKALGRLSHSTDTSPADSPARKPPSQDTDQQQQQSADSTKPSKPQENGSNTSFFSTLEWQEENGASVSAMDRESVGGLLDDVSDDDEDGFANLSRRTDAPEGYGQIGGNTTTISTGAEPSLFGSEMTNQPTSLQDDEVDLLNMNTSESNSISGLDSGIDLLNIGGDPSNVDLLSGHASGTSNQTPFSSHPNGQEPDLLGMSSPIAEESSSSDTFDPFQQFSQTRTVNNTPASNTPDITLSSSNTSTAKGNNSSSQFDPFMDLMGNNSQQTSSSANQTSTNSKPQKQADVSDNDFFAFMESGSSSKPPAKSPNPKGGEADLMGSWNSANLSNFQSSPSQPPPSSNLTPGPGIHKSASTGSAMSFQSLASGRNSPSMNMGMGMGPSTNGQIGPVPCNDPFADLGNLGKTSFKGHGGMANTKPGIAPMGATTNSNAAFQQPTASSQKPPMGNSYNQQHSPQHHPSRPSPQHSAAKPNYSSSVIGGRTDRGVRKNFAAAASGASPKPKVTSDTFNDLLGDISFTSRKDNEPKTLGDMRKKGLEEVMDPDKLKLMEWTQGKEKNIRALICSLSNILWDGEARWRTVGMHELVTPEQVKKWYRKAVLCVHPDKLTDNPNQPLAILVFMELNDAWAKFEEEGCKALY